MMSLVVKALDVRHAQFPTGVGECVYNSRSTESELDRANLPVEAGSDCLGIKSEGKT